MKRLQGVFIILAALLVVGCGGLKKMKKEEANVKYEVTPSPLQMHGDEVAVTIKTTIPAKYFYKKAIVEATPYLKWDGGEQAFTMQKLQGEAVQDNNKVISYEQGGNVTYTAKVPFKAGMKMSELEVRLRGYMPGKEDKAIDFTSRVIAKGVISTPTLLDTDARGIIGKDNFKRIVPETKYAEILYTIQQSNVRGSAARTEQMKALKSYIKEVKANDRKEFKGVSISSYASPDGNEQEINAPLSKRRGKSAVKYVERDFRKVKEAKDNENFISSQTTAEDWAGFKELVEASDLADKNLILRVLSMYSDPAQREKEIKNISATYVDLAKNILPKLRRSKINVNVDLIGYSDDEIKAIYSVKPDSLNIEELLYAATLTNNVDEKIAIYLKAGEIVPKCWRPFNNAAVLYMEKGDLAAAKTQLKKAKELEPNNTIVLNNCGAIQLREGNYDKALELLTSAAGAGEAVNYNRGIISIKKGEYATAITEFGSDCSFNAALASLLNGDNSKALKTIDCTTNKTGKLYYLKAIVGARNSDLNMVLDNLRKAFEKDASLKEIAKKDMEFFSYLSNSTFKALVF